MALSGNQITRPGGISSHAAYGGFTAKAESDISISVDAPSLYANWDVEILLKADIDAQTFVNVNFDVDQYIKPYFKADIDG